MRYTSYMPVHFDEDKQLRRSLELRHKEAEHFAQMISDSTGIPYVDLTLVSVSPDALAEIEEHEARALKVAAYQMAGKSISVAAFSPTKAEVVALIARLEKAGFIPKLFVATELSLERAWKYYEDIQRIERTKIGQIDISADAIANFSKDVHTISDASKVVRELVTAKSGTRTTDTLEALLASAIALGASDIHLEPEESLVKARFRLDGLLHDIATFNAHIYKLLISRIKLLSALKLNVESSRQDGRFSVATGESAVDIRTSIIPGAYGESAVLRILDPDSIKVTLAQLGMSKLMLDIMVREIGKPNGLILNTGPTGSGKTTTLYTFIKEVNNPGVKIITIEDPIEYHVEGVVQTQVNQKKGYTFFEGLKSAMRQDPDIIMVGEIRDNETAGTAVDAALTGHLVFSTLHTNNAAGTIPRLIDLGVNPKVLGPALNVAMAQRLIRRLCKTCSQDVDPTDEQLAIINKQVTSLKEIEIEVVVPDKLKAPVGCTKCSGIGYKGRMGVYELILINDDIETLLDKNPSEREIWAIARKQKIPQLAEDGIMKVLEGLTTIEELARVVDLS